MTVWIDGFCSDIYGLFAELREAAQGIEHGAEQRILVQEEALARASDEEDRYVESGTLDWLKLAIPRVLRSSLVISTHSVVETSLGAVCRRIREQRTLSLSLSDLAGRGGIDRSRNYLVKVAGIDLNDLDPLWAELKDWTNVRDCIAHAGGEVERMNNAPQIRNAVNRLRGVGFGESYALTTVIEIEAHACEAFIDLGQKILQAVLGKAFGPNPWETR